MTETGPEATSRTAVKQTGRNNLQKVNEFGSILCSTFAILSVPTNNYTRLRVEL